MLPIQNSRNLSNGNQTNQNTQIKFNNTANVDYLNYSISFTHKIIKKLIK